MHDPVLDALMASIESRQSVALVMVTKGEGVYADAVGARAVMWPFPAEESSACQILRIGELLTQGTQADRAPGDPRQRALARLDYAMADGQSQPLCRGPTAARPI